MSKDDRDLHTTGIPEGNRGLRSDEDESIVEATRLIYRVIVADNEVNTILGQATKLANEELHHIMAEMNEAKGRAVRKMIVEILTNLILSSR